MARTPTIQISCRGARWAGLALSALAACHGGQSDSGGLGHIAAAVTVDVTTNQIGRLVSKGKGPQRDFHSYVALVRPTRRQYAVDGASYVYTAVYGYPRTAILLCANNACGSIGAPGTVLVSSSFPDGEKASYTFDTGGLPQGVTATPCLDSPAHSDGSCASAGSPQVIVSRVARNARGQTVQVVYGDGTEQDHCYNDGSSCGSSTQPNSNLR